MNFRRLLIYVFQAWTFAILGSVLVGPLVVAGRLFNTLQPGLNHTLDRHFDPKQAHLDDGKAKREKGDYDGAIAAYNQALELDAQYTPAYDYRGEAKAAMDDNEGAIADYNTVLALDPNDFEAYFSRGQAEAALGDYDGAIADYDHALAMDPGDAESCANLGMTKDSKGDHAAAMADLNHAIELDPKDGYCHVDRGVVEEVHGDFAAALADYEQEIKLNPDDTFSYYPRLYRQLLLRRLGRPADDFAKTVAGWKDGWAKTLGLYLAGSLDETALLTAAETKHLEPVKGQQCEAYYFIGLTHRLNGDQTGARDFLQKCAATDLKDYNEYKFAQAELARLDPAQ